MNAHIGIGDLAALAAQGLRHAVFAPHCRPSASPSASLR